MTIFPQGSVYVPPGTSNYVKLHATNEIIAETEEGFGENYLPYSHIVFLYMVLSHLFRPLPCPQHPQKTISDMFNERFPVPLSDYYY